MSVPNSTTSPHSVVTKYDKIVLIGVGGPSSSGKTTVAKALHSTFESSLLIHLDDFYLPDDEIPFNTEFNEQDWDCPQAIDFAKFTQYINDIKVGNNLQKEIDTLEPGAKLTLTPQEQTKFKLELQKKQLDNTLIVFVDGFMLYHDPSIAQLFDIRLFFHADFNTLKQRRESRAGYNTVGGFWVDPPGYFEKIVWPAYADNHKYLFQNDDVNSDLNDYALKELKLLDYKNQDSNSLSDLIDWSLNVILEKFKDKR